MANAIRDHNVARQSKQDEKIIPLCFANFDVLLPKLTDAHKDLYPASELISLFDHYADFVDDERVLQVLQEVLFTTDSALKSLIEEKEQLKWQQLESGVIKDLQKIEDRLRETGIATSGSEPSAIRLLIYLVFMKLFEEKKFIEGRGKNWFQPKSFIEFQEAQGEKETKHAIHKLFEQIKNFKEFQDTALFTQYDHLPDKPEFNDDFVLKEIIETLDKYAFYKTKVDGLGAVYEVLAGRSSKDVKAGQFFTPLNVVRFMVQLADLDHKDTILDPACGTGRFLIWAMDDMLSGISGKDTADEKETLKKQRLFGSDIDSNVAKLAKMNMYIHGDGKGHIWDNDGLLLYKTHATEGKLDVILTNPPLGKMNYRRSEYDDEFFKKMSIIPRFEAKEGVEEEENADIRGNLIKGGALFVNICQHYLKPVRNPDAPLEWRGGKLLMVLDEGILNTEPYEGTQDFIKNNFYIKAVISLTPDTFVPVSKTPNKTSVIYAIKKDDISAKQTEPIFFAHSDKVGITTKRKPTQNHLIDVLKKYGEFKKNVLGSYSGMVFNKNKFLAFKMKPQKIVGESDWYYRLPDEMLEHRLDYVYQHPKYDEIRRIISTPDFKSLEELIDPKHTNYGLTASGLETGEIPFVNIENLSLTGNIDSSNMRYVNEVPKNKLLSEDDILISRSRLPGVCVAVTKESEGWTFGSYIIRFKPLLDKIIPLYLAKCINSKIGQEQISYLKTGAVGSNINKGQMYKIRIVWRSIPEQQAILKKILNVEKQGIELDRKAREKWLEARSEIDNIYK